MKRNLLPFLLSTIAILMAMVACVIPGRVAQPAPDSNLNAISTTIAETVRSAATQTASAQPVETKSPTGKTGTALEQLEDGTTKYSDFDAGFEVTLPAG